MNQWYVKKRHMFVVLTLVGAILMGLVWLAGVPGSASAQGTLLLNTSYKDATPRKVGAGGTVAYSIVLHNGTQTTTTAIDVTDPLEPRLSYVSGSANVIGGGGMGGYTAGQVRFSVDPIAAGATVTLSFQATVTTTVLPGDIITNTASITEGGISFTRFVTVTVDDYPSVQINEPWNNQLFTTRGTFTIRGRAWTGDEPGFPEPPVLQAISNGGGFNDWYTVQWTAVPNAIAYILQESTDPYFSQIRNEYTVTGGATSKYVDNQPRGRTYYYRAKTRTSEYESRWSAVQSVTVALNPTGMLFQPLNAAPVMPSVAPLSAVAAPTVEVNIKKVGVVQPDNWQQATTITPDPTGDWWNWTFVWSLPTEDDAQYDIQVRAKGVDGGFDPEKIDTVRVTIRNGMRFVYLPLVMKRYPPVPYAPTLAVPSNDTYGNYQLSWSYNHPGDPYLPTSYTLQEASDANFTNLLFNQTATSPRSYTNKAVGTYYYRVRGHNAYGPGPWSNVQTVTVLPRGFFDDFSNVNSGWPRQIFKIGDRGVLDASYDNGYYRMKILLDTQYQNNKRIGIVPAPYNNIATNYDVEVVHRFVRASDQSYDPGWGDAGLVFAAAKSASGYFSTIYSVHWSFDGRCSVVKRTSIDSYIPVSWVNMTNLLGSVGCPGGYSGGYDRDITVRAQVRGSQVTVYINNVSLGSVSDGGIGTMHQMGLTTASWEHTPVQSRFDNFRLTAR